MQSIEMLVHRATDGPIGTIVHVGAGRGAVLERYARLAPSAVVLVEGDPDIAAALQRAVLQYSWARVVARAVAANDGELSWHRYTLPALNGPLSADALASNYPSLHKQASTSVTAISLSSVLHSALDGADPDRAALLVLDVPGQEALLLDSIGDDLGRLSGVVIRRCARSLPGAISWPEVLERMRARSFELVGHEADEEPLWPIACFKFDQRRYERSCMLREIEALKIQLSLLKGQLRDAEIAAQRTAADYSRNAESLTRGKAAAEHLLDEREASVQQLKRTCDEQAARIESLRHDKAAAEQLLVEREASVQQLERVRDEQAGQIVSLTQGKAAAEHLVFEREESVQQLERMRDEQAVQIMSLTQGKAADEQLLFEREESVQQLEWMRDEQAAQIESLTKGKTAAEQLLVEREASVQQLQNDLNEQEFAYRKLRETTSVLDAQLVALKIEFNQAADREESLRGFRNIESKELGSLRRTHAILQNNFADLQQQYRALWSGAGAASNRHAGANHRLPAGIAASAAASGVTGRRRRRRISEVIAANQPTSISMTEHQSAAKNDDRPLTQASKKRRTESA